MFSSIEEAKIVSAFRNQSIGRKVVGLVFFLLIASSALMGFMYKEIGELGSTIKSVSDRELVVAKDISDIALEQGRQAVLLERGIRNGQNVLYDESLRSVVEKAKLDFDALTVSIKSKLRKCQDMIARVLKSTSDNGNKKQLTLLATEMKKVESSHQVYIDLGNKLFSAALENRMHDVGVLAVEAEKAELKVHTISKEFLGMIQMTTKAAAEAASKEEQLMTQIIVVAVPAIIVFFMLFALAFSRIITKQLGQSIDIAERISQGDLTAQDVIIKSKDEAGKVAHAMQVMNTNLKKFVGSISESSHLVNNVAGEIVDANKKMSERVSQQIQVLDQTTTTVDELTRSVKETTTNVAEADTYAARSRNQAGDGVSIGAEAIDAINDLEKSNKKIEQIVQVIDDIAFQTNLLALNAAVEAARAGEQGRGFSVVATEVRSLAGRSAESAKEIKALVQISAERMEIGTEKVHACGEAFSDILSSGEKTAHIVSQISQASEEQARQIEGVNDALIEIEKIGQQNMYMVEESESASRTLGQQAERMDNILAYYTLNDGDQKNENQESKNLSGSGSIVHSARFKKAS